MATEDFEEDLVDSLISIEKRVPWEFAIEIEGAPKELDILARDISYNPLTVNTDQRNYGSQTITTPTGKDAIELTITLRDTKDRKLYKYLKKLSTEVVHLDGTFGVPSQYVREVTMFSTTDKDSDSSPEIYHMFISNIGDINPDRSSRDQHMEFTVTFTQYKTSGVNEVDDLGNTIISSIESF